MRKQASTDRGSASRTPLQPAAERPSVDRTAAARAPSSAAFWIAALFLATNAHLAYWLSRAPPPPPPAPLPAVVVTGQRIPRTFFRTRGAGQSGVGIETGSFDAALYNASIADQNIVK